MNLFSQLAGWTLATNLIYIFWLSFVHPPLFFFILECAVVLLNILFIVNNRKRTYVLSGGPYSLRPIVDIFITIKNENISLFEKTLFAATKILYPNKRIYVLDDGNRREIEELTEKNGCVYLTRKDSSLFPYKANNLNYGLKNSYGNFILVLDADMVASNNILDNLLGFFNEEKVAIVATRQGFNLDRKDFNHDTLFYEYAQTGKNTFNAAISCGSGVIYRRSALEKIGGFQEWNIVEDLYTSYVLHSNGFKSIYVSQSYTYGDAPTNISAIYKQRGTWAQDTLRIFIFRNPLFQKGLSFFQRTQYFEMGFVYIVSGLIFPIMYSINMISLLTNNPIIDVGKEWYLIFRIPAFILSIYMFKKLSHEEKSVQMWAGLFPIFFVAFFKALLYKKPVYKVTPKGLSPTSSYMLVWPQITLLIVGIFSVIFHLITYGITWVFIINSFWICVMIYYNLPIIIKSIDIKYI